MLDQVERRLVVEKSGTGYLVFKSPALVIRPEKNI